MLHFKIWFGVAKSEWTLLHNCDFSGDNTLITGFIKNNNKTITHLMVLYPGLHGELVPEKHLFLLLSLTIRS